MAQELFAEPFELTESQLHAVAGGRHGGSLTHGRHHGDILEIGSISIVVDIGNGNQVTVDGQGGSTGNTVDIGNGNKVKIRLF